MKVQCSTKFTIKENASTDSSTAQQGNSREVVVMPPGLSIGFIFLDLLQPFLLIQLLLQIEIIQSHLSAVSLPTQTNKQKNKHFRHDTNYLMINVTGTTNSCDKTADQGDM